MKNRLLYDIDTLLDEVARRHLVLLDESGNGDIDVWSPNTKLPIALRRAIRKHRGELATLLEQSDIRVCPSKELHRASWHYSEGQFVCGICEQLAPWVNAVDRHQVEPVPVQKRKRRTRHVHKHAIAI